MKLFYAFVIRATHKCDAEADTQMHETKLRFFIAS